MNNLTRSLKRKVQSVLRDVKNTSSRLTYKDVKLTEKQQKVLAELKQNGFVMIPVEDAFTTAQWDRYCAGIDGFVNDSVTQTKRAEYHAIGKTEGDGSFSKTFILRGADLNKDFLKTTPLSELKQNDFLKPVIDNYYGQASKVIYIDYWYTLKTHNPNQDVYSQAWHCDPEGDKIVKVFVYFSDVDERSGALQYIKGTHHGGKNAAALKDIRRNTSFYPEQSFVDANFPKDDIIQAKAPKGTIMICDTRGLHRGGKCLDNERILGVLEYLDMGSFAHEVM
ncbi:MAG: phytanoyl-CoA dioxygenase family protein [Chitinophagaceae bacterium]